MKCGFIWGTFLSLTVFSMIIYGIQKLIILCDIIEQDVNDKKNINEQNNPRNEITELSEEGASYNLSQDLENSKDTNLQTSLQTKNLESDNTMKQNSEEFDGKKNPTQTEEQPIEEYRVITFHRKPKQN